MLVTNTNTACWGWRIRFGRLSRTAAPSPLPPSPSLDCAYFYRISRRRSLGVCSNASTAAERRDPRVFISREVNHRHVRPIPDLGVPISSVRRAVFHSWRDPAARRVPTRPTWASLNEIYAEPRQTRSRLQTTYKRVYRYRVTLR